MEMKKVYLSPEAEVFELLMKQPLLAGSEKDDITDGPVPIITDPTPEDKEEW